MMKKILFFLFAACVAASVNAQLVVDESGNVAVGYGGTSAIASDFSINSVGQSSATGYVQSVDKTYGLYVKESIPSSAPPVPAKGGGEKTPPVYYQYGVYSTTSPIESNRAYGVYGKSTVSSTLSDGKNYGLYGVASNAQQGGNYGVFGRVSGSRNGAGVYGTSVSTDSIGATVPGRYAGYFNGNVYVNGSIQGTMSMSSDYRLKENIKSLSETHPYSLQTIMQMNPIEFNYKQRILGYDGNGNPEYMYTDDNLTYNHKHFGLIAQELQELFPNLIYEGVMGDGYLSVAYVELVPVLIRAIQELNTKLDETRKAAGVSEDVTPVEAVALRGMKTELFQNTPNPFTENTVIPCTIAEGVATAMLYIYDLNGKQIDQYPIEDRGKTCVTIAGRSLEAGMYLYSLIADGNVVDTKRMILTK